MTRPAQEPAQRPDLRAEPRTRARTINNEVDEFHIDPASVPDGVSVEWKRATVFGKDEVEHQMRMEQQGWLPAEASMFPGLMPKGHKGPITRGGMILMERPSELTAEARAEDLRNAREQVSDNESQLRIAPDGTGPRDHAQVAPRVNREMLAVPE